MQGFRMRNLALFLGHPREFETVLANGLNIVVPEVDQRHVVAMQCKVSAHVATDGTAANHHDSLSHHFLPHFLAEASYRLKRVL